MVSLLGVLSKEMLCKRPEKCTFCGHWQINGNRNWWFPFTRNKSPPELTNTFQVGSCSSPLLQIGAPSPPRMMSRTATAGFPKEPERPKFLSFWVDSNLFLRSMARPDDPSKDNFLEELAGGNSEACQMGRVLHAQLQSVIQVTSAVDHGRLARRCAKSGQGGEEDGECDLSSGGTSWLPVAASCPAERHL